MKKIIKRFKEQNKTKKIVIIYITISFIFIAGFSLYNALNKHEQLTQITSVSETKSENKNTEKNETEIHKETDNDNVEITKDSEETGQTEENKTNETDKDNNSTYSNQKNIKSDKGESKTEDNTSTNNTTNNSSESDINQNTDSKQDMITVNIEVTGINNIMMKGNITIKKGENAYTALKQIASQNGIKISTSGFGKMIYVRGIGDLFEKQHGSLSGWMYKVNNVSPNYSAGSYTLNDGDYVLWYYANYE